MSEANFNHLSEDSKQESVSISLGHDSGKIQEDNKQDSRELVIDPTLRGSEQRDQFICGSEQHSFTQAGM
jgi:hypothetical protein